VLVTARQAGDHPNSSPGRPRTTADGVGKDTFRLLADKAYSHPSICQQLRARRIPHTMPERTDQQNRRKGQGIIPRRTTTGIRPPETYAERNTVERGFSRLKQWRGIATRYDKYALTFLGGVLLAASTLHTRSKRN
jgi:putative transposase